ncbi:MAG: sigma-70 family RNA polymerase sigma factor [Pleurocapsa sp. CRU_1_2]|nr:sigma-70 family RNA polymerase sigma factor [Pleurocapsa sp. CRU_1_2]
MLKNEAIKKQTADLFVKYLANKAESLNKRGAEVLDPYPIELLKIRNKIAELNLRLVGKVALRFSLKNREAFEDLYQVGTLGLIKAIEKFDPAQGYQFSSLAIKFIEGSILHYLRDKSSIIKIPRNIYEDKTNPLIKIETISLEKKVNLGNAEASNLLDFIMDPKSDQDSVYESIEIQKAIAKLSKLEKKIIEHIFLRTSPKKSLQKLVEYAHEL